MLRVFNLKNKTEKHLLEVLIHVCDHPNKLTFLKSMENRKYQNRTHYQFVNYQLNTVECLTNNKINIDTPLTYYIYGKNF